ncbi:MAG: Nif3-like dinuclear metal center hexameric protein [Phycisphaeraceae bacterium]
MRVRDVVYALHQLAPEHLAESWDKVGLHVGDLDWIIPHNPKRKPCALLCIDLTEPVMAEAIRLGVGMIVAYHPPIFDPLPALTTKHWKQRLLIEAVQRKIAIYSPHTALDSAPGGVNDWLCESVLPGVMEAVSHTAAHGSLATGGAIRPIKPASATKKDRPYKLVAFIPPEHLDAVRFALCKAGAGQIGDYSECSFSIEGEGTFRGGETTNPTIGKRGRLERTIERRLETIVPAARLAEVVAALMKAHPYEEPAFDLIRLDLPPSSGGEGVGQGRVVTLDKPLGVKTFIDRLKKQLRAGRLEVALPRGLKHVRTVGFCAGAGGSLLSDAGPVDAFFTGEMRHHQVLDALAQGTMILLAGHTQTERPYLPVYRSRITKLLGRGITWHISKADKPPTSVR